MEDQEDKFIEKKAEPIIFKFFLDSNIVMNRRTTKEKVDLKETIIKAYFEFLDLRVLQYPGRNILQAFETRL